MLTILTVTKSTSILYIYDQSDDWVARKVALEDAGKAEEHIITESAPNEPKRGGGT